MNLDNAKIVIKSLDEFYKDKINIANVGYPSEILEKSNEWLIYIFYSCMLDYGMRSSLYQNNLINTYRTHKEIFSPSYIVNDLKSEDELLSIVKNSVHHRYPKIATKKWIKLSNKLIKYNSLIDYIKSFKSMNELDNFIKSLDSYGQKTGGLLSRLIYEANILETNQDLTSIPLDRHDIEISYLNNIITSATLSNNEIKCLSDLYIKAGRELNIKSNMVDKYLWQCGVDFCTKKKCSECPLNKNCKKV